ncbi:MAG: DUF177 domain-containing protein [Deltaproteobacteria bacterium]
MYIRVSDIPREGLDLTGARGSSWIGHLLDGMDPSPFRSLRIPAATLFLAMVGRDLEASGSFAVEGDCPCDRCSETVRIRLNQEFRTLFVPRDLGPAGSADVELMPDDLDLGFYDGAGIEVNDIFWEQVALAIPAKILCREDCLGLCPRCGANRNREDCGCPADAAETPFHVLKTLLEKKE